MVQGVKRAGEPPGSFLLSRRLGRLLRRAGLTLAVAESCTGGLLGGRLSAVPGSSEYFLGGVIAYANQVKRDLLGVAPETLEAHGAVSAPCAAEMASGARRVVGSDLALALTGIAGPGGGTPSKPVGLVYAALAGPEGTEVRELHLRGSRARIREAALRSVLEWLCQELERGGEEGP